MKLYQSPYHINSYEDIYYIYDKEETNILHITKYTSISDMLLKMGYSQKDFFNFIWDRKGRFILPIEYNNALIYYDSNYGGTWELLKFYMKDFFKKPRMIYIIIF